MENFSRVHADGQEVHEKREKTIEAIWLFLSRLFNDFVIGFPRPQPSPTKGEGV
jgi:hypothetical protein